jgi:chemotaxis protein methyltransferase CheR
MPRELFQKYSHPGEPPRFYCISEEIKSRVFPQRHNLLSLKPVGNDFSLGLCKNLLLHFQPWERVEVIRMFHQSLAPGGFFAREQIEKLPPEMASYFEQTSGDTQIFRKVQGAS